MNSMLDILSFRNLVGFYYAKFKNANDLKLFMASNEIGNGTKQRRDPTLVCIAIELLTYDEDFPATICTVNTN